MYEIDDTPLPVPPLPGQVVLTADADEAIERLGIDLVQHAGNCVRKFGDFHVALSGGEHPRKLYRRLMYAPEFRWIPWRRTHLWFTSERCTGLDDEASTFRSINDFIGDHSDLPPEQFHPIFAAAPTAADDYERRLREHLGWRERGQDRLDFVLLTVDAHGGTAGLPGRTGAEPVNDDGRLVVRSPRGADADGPDHITMLPSIINSARFVAVLAAGPEPADGLAIAAAGAAGDTAAASAPDAPIRQIRPVRGELTWYVDPSACRRILTEDELSVLTPQPAISTADRLAALGEDHEDGDRGSADGSHDASPSD